MFSKEYKWLRSISKVFTGPNNYGDANPNTTEISSYPCQYGKDPPTADEERYRESEDKEALSLSTSSTANWSRYSENQCGNPRDANVKLPCDPTTLSHGTVPRTHLPALLTTHRKWKQPKRLSADECRMEIWYIYTLKCTTL